MLFNIIHKRKVIFFYMPKCGVTSNIEMIMHLQNGKVPIFNHVEEKHRYYHSNCIEKPRERVDYSKYHKFLCIRNPYHRIISCFFDKYVFQVKFGLPKVEELEDGAPLVMELRQILSWG